MFNPLKAFSHITKERMRAIMIQTYQTYHNQTSDLKSKEIIKRIIKAIHKDDDVLFYRIKGELDVREAEIREQLRRKITQH
jgi:hypothetical protein